ncbi:MAG TPA: hypothetical protein VMR45_02485 [Patescibacteria group bacterium]|nr:hypothetical protein [Patescibacteria group bacterium]
MSSQAEAGTVEPAFRYFHMPQTMIARFVARRTMLVAAFWALAFGALVAAKATGYATTYPTLAEREKLSQLFGNNIGMKALLGAPQHLEQATGFTAWYTVGVMVIVGAIWAMLLATKTFRGEEDAGRWELLLSGQTTARRAAANVLIGLGAAATTFFAVIALTLVEVGRTHSVSYSASAALFLALVVISNVILFILVGAVASQLMPTRARATSLAAGVFGICFLIRATADTTELHWLLNLTPLGWLEKTQPLYGSHPMWLAPVAVLIVILTALTIFLAGRRDLGASTFVDSDTAKAHTRLLNTPLGIAARLMRPTAIKWILAVGFISFYFGLLAKSAAQVLDVSASAQGIFSRLAHQAQITSINAFLSIAFFMTTLLIMAFAASNVSDTRNEEAEGYLDNLVVRPYGRVRWLWGRLFLTILAIIVAGFTAGAVAWMGVAIQHGGMSFSSILLAGLNGAVPAILLAGIGVFCFGVWPRMTSLVTYGVVAWAFLLEMVSAGLNLNHWILDTSLLNHVVMAPLASPDWAKNLLLVAIGLAFAAVGSMAFNRRDLKPE